MYKAKLITLICLCGVISSAQAQYSSAIRSLRPGVTVNPITAGKNILQFQIGGTKSWYGKREDTAVVYKESGIVNATMCYGITNKLELDVVAERRDDNTDVNGLNRNSSGFSLAAVGARYTFYQGDAHSPSIGMQALVKLPWQSQDFAMNKAGSRVLLLLGYEPTYVVSLTANIGLDYSGNGKDPIGLYSFKSAFLLSPKLGAFVETFGNYDHRYVFNNVGGGLYYFISNNFQLDAHGGYGIGKRQYASYLSLGISFRFFTGKQQQDYRDYYYYR